MLMDALGLAIAFITVILLMSIVVTALVQTSQALLRLRARNLMKCLAQLLLKAREQDPSRKNDKKAREDATRILNARNVALINRVGKPMSNLHYWLLGPKVSWLDSDQLPDAISEELKDLAGKAKDIERDFERAQSAMEKRFQVIIRGWTFGWALIVAFSFQVSTPDLLNRLQANAELRALILADVDSAVEFADAALGQLNYSAASEEALEQLKEKFPTNAELLEEASGVGSDRGFILEEMDLVLEDGVAAESITRRRAEEILDAYKDLLDGEARKQRSQAMAIAGDATSRLNRYGIGLWRDGWEFYHSDRVNWSAVAGVMITAILLSLGAPFWFKKLQEVLSLRDVLAGKKPAENSGQDHGSPPANSSRPGEGGP